jgi:Domain of unknown function (DUF1707)
MTGGTDGAGTGSEPPGGPRVRASDADRQRVVHRLQEAVARGLLTFDEGSERMGQAWASRHLDELPELTADLPAPAPPVPAPAAAPGWRVLALLAVLQLRTTLGGAAGPASRVARVRLAAVSVAALLAVGLLLGLAVGGLAAHAPGPGGFDGFGGPHFHR